MQRQEREREGRAKKLSYWRPHMEAWQASSQAATHYCKTHGVNASTFKYWQYIILGKPSLEREKESLSVAPLFLEATVPMASKRSSTSLTIETPKGYRIILESLDLLNDLATIFKLSEQI